MINIEGKLPVIQKMTFLLFTIAEEEASAYCNIYPTTADAGGQSSFVRSYTR
jgi:hypothetical protein